MLFRTISLTSAVTLLMAASLPQTGPIPEQKPDQEQAQPSGAPPIPAEKPVTSPDKPVVPAEKPSAEPEEKPATQPEEQTTGEMQGPPRPPLTVATEPDEEHQACLKELTAMEATFKEIPRIDDGNGCGIDKPISLASPLPGIEFKPEGEMRCEAALALAQWMKESVIPSAAALDDGKIVTVNQASTYVCRLRNNASTGKISEHARGNAIDVASFTFENGKIIAIEPRREDPTMTGAFQRAASASACLYFTTVLDPESDAAHETHFHLDVIERNGGFRYCH
ncbi:MULTISPECIES: extensin family protein [unclassified Rhizobium]|uniref:extensin family protein n=1 Tax=unclassified Rhizobium TaxID=2613769 RepID=UPI000EA86B28|nr:MULTISPECIES: extensin family protein [unclassified Rhizobium]AYG66896.1 extensin [Rhizobium sp. CCGE531]AYG73276.1 extensin [Rhizobium sp. CCGE532]